MKNSPRSLQLRYALFLATTVITIIASLFIILYSLDNQSEDAKLINIAGRQRMLSQRISKLTLFLYYSDENEILRKTYNFDSLRLHVNFWKSTHYYLIDQNKKEGKSEVIGSLLNINTPRLEKICSACNLAIKNPTHENLRFAIDQIATVERPFLLTMEKTVKAYQHEAENKLSKAKKVVTSLCLLALIIFILEFLFVFYPALFDLNRSNQELSDLNNQLSVANGELMASEEEIRTNMEQIHELKDHLEISERQFRELVDDATDMIYELSADGKFSFANPIMENVTGYSKAELCKKLYYDLVHEEDRESVVRFYKKQMEKQEPVSYLEFRINTSKGKVLWVGQNVKMFFDKKWVYKVSVVSRDITEIKAIETQLHRERLLLRTIIDNIPVNIYVKDAHSKKILVNRSEIEHMGVTSEEEILGKDDFELYPVESAKISVDEDKKVMNGEIILNRETQNTLNDGTQKWFRTSKIPLRDDQEKIIGLVGISVDITEAKENEFDLQKAKVKAEEATLAKSRFLGTMSHEIRTPLNGIIGITNILNDHPRADQVENLKLLKFSCDNLLAIINDILDFNKIEAGKMELEQIPFNLVEMARQYSKMLSVKANQKGIELKLKMDDRLPHHVIGDPVRLGQILNNLIGNAIKFTEKGYVEFSISEIEKIEGAHRIKFSVTDTGIGIPPDKVDDIFSGFSQASSDTTRKFGGTGLGLSITRKLLELMGSKVNVKSKLNEGSEFYFELTLNESAPTLHDQPEFFTKSGAFNNLKVLVIDDNQVNLVVAKNYLNKLGCTPTTVGSGDEGIKLLAHEKFDLVLLDLQMPEKNGFQTAVEIRNKGDKYFKEVPVIALSADVLPEIKAQAIQSGMNDYLTKPFQIEELEVIISKHTKHSNAKSSQVWFNVKEMAQGDEGYTKELAHHIVVNLKELLSALTEALRIQNAEPFEKALHKLKTALFILRHKELDEVLKKIKQSWSDGNYQSASLLKNEFESIVAEIVSDLS